MASGLFITFEGIDGAGKSTHVEALAAAFEAQGRVVCRTREPGGTPLAERLRDLFVNQSMDVLTEALLVFAARRDHLTQRIEPALARGEVVLCDRFTDASFAYQGAARGLDWAVLQDLAGWVQTVSAVEGGSTLREPDLTLWFDLPAEVAAERLQGARVPDRFESQPTAFFDTVRQGYARRLGEAPQRLTRIDAHQSREAVWECVVSQVRAKGWLA